ncbi:MAG: hypothetical protein ACC653_12380 [Gammaproteobacteria bacterium]
MLIKSVAIFILLFLVIKFNTVMANTLFDPTRPPGAQTQKQSKPSSKRYPSWRLSSILIASERKIATINGKLLRKGDRVNGATLIDIQSWNVTLVKNNKTFKVYMFKKLKVRKEQ